MEGLSLKALEWTKAGSRALSYEFKKTFLLEMNVKYKISLKAIRLHAN